MFDIFLLVLLLALTLIFALCFLAYKRKIERVEATVQTLQEREEMRTVFHDPSISLKWGRKSAHTTTPPQPERSRVGHAAPQLNTDALAQALQDRLGATHASQLVRVLETDPEQLKITMPSVRSLLSRNR